MLLPMPTLPSMGSLTLTLFTVNFFILCMDDDDDDYDDDGDGGGDRKLTPPV
jgi:hypothetical protein